MKTLYKSKTQIYKKERKSTGREINVMDVKYLWFLISPVENVQNISPVENVQNNNNNISADYSIWISELNDRNVIRNWMKELGVEYYKKLTLPVQFYTIIWKW